MNSEDRHSRKKPVQSEAHPGRRFTDDPLWYKDAVIYQVHVKSFLDADNDGIGDFAGLISKLDYIAELGVNTIWLLPFYPSPRRDDGYDIAEYRGVHTDYGTVADVKRFIHEAHKRRLRVITELVINHTSDQHPWFQRARNAKPGSAARDFYVWSDTDTAYSQTRIIFTDTEKSNWTWDPVANAYYWHRFFSHQPDLNFDNPAVLRTIIRIMRFWLDMGVDGLRLDAVPYLIEREGTSNENLPETHAILKKIRAEVDKNYPDRMLLAEANMWPEDVQAYFGDSDECQMAFHFPLMPRMYLALAQEDRFPITDILRQTPEIPPECQWAVFLRNHDELTLEMVTEEERAYMYNFYAGERRARLNVGIRRRLAPLLKRDRRRLQLLNSLLLSMPGTPVIYYGDEIGMGDNIHLGDRDGVRTPMQWTPDRNGGFSRVDPARLVLPCIMDNQYGYQSINVEAQQADPHSLLNWMKRMLAIRKQYQAFGRGPLKLLYPDNRKILCYLRTYSPSAPEVSTTGDNEAQAELTNTQLQNGENQHTQHSQVILCVANMSSAAQAVTLDLSEFSGLYPVEMINGSIFPCITAQPYVLTLAPFDFFWFRLTPAEQLAAPPEGRQEHKPEYYTLVLADGLKDIFRDEPRHILEQSILPAYLADQAWYRHSEDAKLSLSLIGQLPSHASADQESDAFLLAQVSSAGEQAYFLPLAKIADSNSASVRPILNATPTSTLTRVRQGPVISMLSDAAALDSFALTLLHHLQGESRLPIAEGEIRFAKHVQEHAQAHAQAHYWQPSLPRETEISRPAHAQGNSTIVIHDVAAIKLLREMTPAPHPALDMAHHLQQADFRHTPALIGSASIERADGSSTPWLLAYEFVHHQGDGWQWSLDRLERLLKHSEANEVLDKDVLHSESPDSHALADTSPMKELDLFARMLGKRLADLHEALAKKTADTDTAPHACFAPETITAQDAQAWQQRITAHLQQILRLLAEPRWHDSPYAELIQQVLARGNELQAVVNDLAEKTQGEVRTRIHGHLHLAQVLVISGDVMFINFEGDPASSLTQRLAKDHPLRDVASLLRSFAYAAAHMEKTDKAKPASDGAKRRSKLLRAYEQHSIQTLLSSYHQQRGLAPAEEHCLLRLHMLETALREIAHEARQRPSWLDVPLHGLLQLLHKEATT